MFYGHQLCQQHHSVFETTQQIEMIQPQPEGRVPSEIGRRIQLFLRVVYSEYPCLISQFEAEYQTHTGQCISPQMYGFEENAWEEMFRHISTVQVETLLVGHPSVSARPLKRSLSQLLFCTLDKCKFFDFDIECENFNYDHVDDDSDKFRNSYEELVASLTVKDLMDVVQDHDDSDSDSFNFKYNNNLLEEYQEFFSEDNPDMGTASSRSFRSVAVGSGFEMNSSVNIPDDLVSTMEEKSCSESSLPPLIGFIDHVSIAGNDFGIGMGIGIEINNNVSSSNSNPVRNSENQENRSPAVKITSDGLAPASVDSQLSDQNKFLDKENDAWRQIQEADNIIGHRLQMLSQIRSKCPVEIEVKPRSKGEECNLQQNRPKRQMSSPALDLDSPSKKVRIVSKDTISLSDSLTTPPLSPSSIVSNQVNEMSSDVDDLENFLGRAASPPFNEADGAHPTSILESLTTKNCVPNPSTSNQHLLNHDLGECLNLQRSAQDVGDTKEILEKDQSDKGGLDKKVKRTRTSAKCHNPQKPTQRYSGSSTLRNPDLWKRVFSSGHESRFIIVACGDGDNNCICKKTNTSWEQLDDLCLPRGSILYAEIIRPIDSQIKILNIIDAAFLGWKNVQSLKFEKRHKRCKKFSKLMNSESPTTTTHFTCLSAVGVGKISHALKKLAKSNGVVPLADGLAFQPTEILFLKAFSSRGRGRSSNSHPDFKSTIRNLISCELKNNQETLPKWGTGSLKPSDHISSAPGCSPA